MKKNISLYSALQLLCLLVVIILALAYISLTLDIFIAGLLSIIAYPICKKVSEIKIFKRKLGNGVGAAAATLSVIIVILAIFSILIPLIYYETSKISQIDFTSLSETLKHSTNKLDNTLARYGLAPTGDIIGSVIGKDSGSVFDFSRITRLFEGVVNYTGSFVFHIFTILFVTFFLIKDRSLIMNAFMAQIPLRHRLRLREIFHKMEGLLSRYFIGLLIEITCMMTLLSLGLSIFGIEGGIFLGCMGGLLNTIPYLGPFIGAVIAIIVDITNCVSTGQYDAMLINTIIIAAVFLGANLIDNIVFQPLIYSKSVQSNPLEIFIVLILAGSIGGILGMVLGIPTYTIIKTFYTEMMIYIKEISESNTPKNS